MISHNGDSEIDREFNRAGILGRASRCEQHWEEPPRIRRIEKDRPSLVAAIIVGLAFLILGFVLFGCAAQQPSAAGAQLQSSISSASTANQAAQKYNDVARNDADLIDAKAGVVIKYWGK